MRVALVLYTRNAVLNSKHILQGMFLLSLVSLYKVVYPKDDETGVPRNTKWKDRD